MGVNIACVCGADMLGYAPCCKDTSRKRCMDPIGTCMPTTFTCCVEFFIHDSFTNPNQIQMNQTSHESNQ